MVVKSDRFIISNVVCGYHVNSHIRAGKIRAGKVCEIRCDSGDWLIVDLGFSARRRSCGVLNGLNGSCKPFTFGEFVEVVLGEARKKDISPLNLLIEAPLSVATNQSRNPTRRWFDRRDKQYRDWYYNAGAGLVLASLNLLARLNAGGIRRQVRLFEGFVSFKPKEAQSSHCDDVMKLKSAVCYPGDACIISHDKDNFKDEDTDCIKSIFTFAGMDFDGIPPVIFGE